MQETSHKKYKKMYKSIEKLAHIIFINFGHIKYHKTVKTYHGRIVIFLEFLWENKNAQVVQVARTGVHIAKNQENWKENQKPKATRPKPTQVDGSGSPERLRGVGLIQIHQDPDPPV